MFEVELLADAEAEFSEAYDWYEKKSASLAGRFYNEVNRFIELIEMSPFHFQVRYTDDLRAAPIKKFPFLIIYWIDEQSKKVYVTSVFHTSRSPKYI